MRLFLTSAGLCTKQLCDAFADFAGPLGGKRVAYIPTAAEHIERQWIDEESERFRAMGAEVDVVDIAQGTIEEWLPTLRTATVLCFGGGDEFRLMKYITSTNLADELNQLLRTRIWVGISAGSMVTNPILYGNISHTLYGESPADTPNIKALQYVPFQFLPHLNSSWFPLLVEENIESLAGTVPAHIYATDDNTALAVNDGTVTVVGDGLCREWNDTL